MLKDSVFASLCLLFFTHHAWADAAPHRFAQAALVNEALTNNPELKALEQSVAVAKGEAVTAGKWQNPDLSLTPAYKREPGEGGEPGRDSFKGTFQLEQLIEYPGKRALRKAIAEKEVSAAELAIQGFRYQLRIKVEKIFSQLLLAQELKKLREEQVRDGRTFLRATQERAKSGYASIVETVRAQAELIAAQKALSESDSQYRSYIRELNALLGREPESALGISGRVEDLPTTLPSPDAVDNAVSKNPAVRAKILAVEKAKLGVDSAKLSRNPDVTAGPSVEYSEDEQIFGVTFSLPLPLWDDKSGEIQKATAEALQATAELDALRREISAAALGAFEKLRSAHRELSLFTPEFRTQLHAAMEQAEKSYAATGTTVLIYLDAKRTYFDTLAEYYHSLSTFLDALAELKAAAGLPIEYQPAKSE
jgi:cobalt-zinc-cadmium efflux system outer membrane protein